MASPFLDILKYNLSGQLLSRLLTFAISTFLIRHVPMNLLGLVNVRMTLLYTTICFLVREPFRKACMNSDLSVKQSQKYALLCIPFSVFITCILSFWWTLLKSDDAEFADQYNSLILVFAASALIETSVEPCAIFALKLGENKLFSFAQSMLTLLQKLIAFLLIVGTNVNQLTAFSIAQIGASVIYAIIYIVSFMKMKYPLEEGGRKPHYEKHQINLIGTLILHSSLKQVLTEGAGYVMVFTNVLSLQEQGVYNTIERLGSLVTRLILAPLEESAFIFFSSRMNRSSATDKNTTGNAEVNRTYFAVLRVIINVGLAVFVFGLPYSALAIRLYGGQVLVENHGHQLLMTYLVYLLIMGVNGLTECFAFASMGTSEILFHGYILTASIILHLVLNVVLSSWIGAFGFIIANCVNSSLRIYFNCRYISGQLKTSAPSVLSLLPSWRLCGSLLINFLIISIASLIFGSDPSDITLIIANISIGGILFLGVLVYLHQVEHLFTPLMVKQD